MASGMEIEEKSGFFVPFMPATSKGNPVVVSREGGKGDFSYSGTQFSGFVE